MADATLPDVSKELLNKRLPILPREDTTAAVSGTVLKPTWRRSSLAGWSVLFGFFVFVRRAGPSSSPLASGVHAPGELRVVSERQIVQHPDGGIVKDLLVREGDTVKKDEILMRLDPLQTNSEFARLEISSIPCVQNGPVWKRFGISGAASLFPSHYSEKQMTRKLRA